MGGDPEGWLMCKTLAVTIVQAKSTRGSIESCFFIFLRIYRSAIFGNKSVVQETGWHQNSYRLYSFRSSWTMSLVF